MPASNNPIIPEAVIFQTVKAGMETLRTDFSSKVDETKTFLYRMLGAYNSIQGYNMYNQCKVIFFRAANPNEPRYIDVSMGWDTDRIQKKMPTIHIIMQSDSPKDDSISLGESNNDAYDFDDEEATYETTYERRFQQQVNLLISGDNSNEKIAIYYVLRAILISYIPYFNELGFDNVSFNGGDVQINTGIAGNFYVRNLSIRFDYNSIAPKFDPSEFARAIQFSIYLKRDDGSFVPPIPESEPDPVP